MKCEKCGKKLKTAKQIVEMVQANPNLSPEQLTICDACEEPHLLTILPSGVKLERVTPKWLKGRSLAEQQHFPPTIELMKRGKKQEELSKVWMERL